MPPVFTLVLRIGPDRARTHPDSYLWLHDNTSQGPHLVLGLDVFVLHNQYFARVFEESLCTYMGLWEMEWVDK